jgi:threonine/homoserine/homoserine lactone efflux protein
MKGKTMVGTQNLSVFIAAGLILNVTPGQDTMYILGRSIAQGRRAGVASALGISTGSLCHTAFAAVGLSAILATSKVAFDVVRYVGAAYLAYLGIRMILERAADIALSGAPPPERSTLRIYGQGILTNVLNPKVALFFLAFLPQFIDPATPIPKGLVMLFLGVVFTFNGTIWCLILATFASAMSRHLRRSGNASACIKKAAGALFIGLGVRLAVSR